MSLNPHSPWKGHSHGFSRNTLSLFVLLNTFSLSATAQDELRLELNGPGTPAYLSFTLHAPAATWVLVEHASELPNWQGYQTLFGEETVQIDGGRVAANQTKFFRARTVTGTNLLSGDHLNTDSGDLVIHPVNHASFIFQWNGRTIYNDPVGGAQPYADFPRADLVLVSHQHGDHYDATTLSAIRGPETIIIAPAAVYSALPAALRQIAIPLANGESTNLLNLGIEAVPAYNANHPRGAGNGYVVTAGGRRLHMSGDTGAIPETRALTNIDVAFLSMNVPFTMTVNDAADVTLAFRPRVVYPYHYRNQGGSFADLEAFRETVSSSPGIEVRFRDWY